MPSSSADAAMYRSRLFCGANRYANNYVAWLYSLYESKGGSSQEIFLIWWSFEIP